MRRSRVWTRSGAWTCSTESITSWSTMPPPCRFISRSTSTGWPSASSGRQEGTSASRATTWRSTDRVMPHLRERRRREKPKGARTVASSAVALGSWGGQRASLADYVTGMKPTGRAITAGRMLALASSGSQADGGPDVAGGHLHRSLHDQAPFHPELEVTRKRADEVILASLHRSLEGDLAGIARSHQGDLGDDLISHGWRNVARLLSCVRGLFHEGFRLGPLLEQDEVMAQRLDLAHGLEDDPQLLTRLCIDHGRRVVHVVADFYLNHLALRALTPRGGDRAQEEDAGGHDRGQTAAAVPSSDLDHVLHRPFPPLGFWSRPRLETPWAASRLLGSPSSRRASGQSAADGDGFEDGPSHPCSLPAPCL